MSQQATHYMLTGERDARPDISFFASEEDLAHAFWDELPSAVQARIERATSIHNIDLILEAGDVKIDEAMDAYLEEWWLTWDVVRIQEERA